MKAARPEKQAERLQALRRYDILDTPREREFDDVVALAAQICEAPIAVINLIDDDRQWFKAEVGLGVRETPLDASICAHAILQPGVYEVPDTLEDPCFQDNPLCTGEPHLRFYTGALLKTEDGHALGTLCVLDHQPRRLTREQVFALEVLSKQVMAQLELRRSLAQSELLMREIDHRVKNSLSMVAGVLHLQAAAAEDEGLKQALDTASSRVNAIAQLHDHLHQAGGRGEVGLDVFLDSLIKALAASAPPDVTVKAALEPVGIDADTASSIGMLVNELVTNSMKHGRSNGHPLEIEVSVSRSDDGLAIAVLDDGPNAALEGLSEPPTGLGMRLLKAVTGGLGGSFSLAREGARTAARLSLPLRRASG